MPQIQIQICHIFLKCNRCVTYRYRFAKICKFAIDSENIYKIQKNAIDLLRKHTGSLKSIKHNRFLPADIFHQNLEEIKDS